MKILELFSGTQSISKVFKDNGWETFTIDNDPYFENITSWKVDILDVEPKDILEKFGQPDVIWASPPCTAFSVASIGTHWTGGKGAYVPKTEFAKISKMIVQQTIYLIQELKPKYWFIENPRGVLRKMPFMEGLPRHTVTYCQYGDKRMKPTDLWTNHPNPQFKPMCKNGDPCHEPAPRGSKTGTQGLKDARERARIPQELCEHIYSLVNDEKYKKREIKFRAWEIASKEMFKWEDVKRERFKILENEHLILLQYTGLTDKNGKDIYEGDIVLNTHHNIKGIVIWDKKQARFYVDYGDDIWSSLNSPLEVTGNRYENLMTLKS